PPLFVSVYFDQTGLGGAMRRSFAALIAAASVAALTQIASAADLPRKAPPAPPLPPPPVLTWTGWYVGLNAGGGWGTNNGVDNAAPPGDCFSGFGALACPQFIAALSTSMPAHFDTRPAGFIGGGQIGYNWQFNNWLAGIETDFQGANIKGDASVVGPR